MYKSLIFLILIISCGNSVDNNLKLKTENEDSFIVPTEERNVKDSSITDDSKDVMIDSLITGSRDTKSIDFEKINKYDKEIVIIKRVFRFIEKKYKVTIKESELVNLCRMVIENK